MNFVGVPLLQDVRASHGGDDWAPLGPFYDRLLVEVFGENEPAMFQALRDGQIDLTDWSVPPSELSAVCNHPNLHCELFGAIDLWGLDFNNHPGARYWGVIKGSDEQAITEIKRAIAHLTDKDEHISVTTGGYAKRIDSLLLYRELLALPFDTLHQDPQTVKDAADDPSLTNAIRVSVVSPDQTPSPNADVFLIHVTGDKNKEGVLGSYAAFCTDGFKCATASSAVKHPGPDGQLGTLDDEFNFIYQTYPEDGKDGIVAFSGNTDPKTNAKIPLPTTGTYIVFAVNRDTDDFGWGHLTPPNDSVTVHTGQLGDSGGWYNKVVYPNAGYEEYCEARDHLVRIHTDINNDSVDDTPFKDADGNCRIDADSAIYSAPGYRRMLFYIRFGVFRQELGDRLSARIETLFGGNDVVDERHVTRSQSIPVVQTGIPFDDWELYTMGWSSGGRTFDGMDGLYNMQWGYPPCGTADPTIVEVTANYPSFCNQLYSSAVRGAANTFDHALGKLANFLHNFALGSLPVWSNAGFQAYHNAWTGVINDVGGGLVPWGVGVSSVLTMHPVTDCAQHGKLLFTDLNSNGCWDFGEPLTMRWSFFSNTRQINYIQSNWKWDAQVWVSLYDTLSNTNPYSYLEGYSAIASSWQNFLSPTAAQLGYTPPDGTVLTQRWFVKNHIGWSDGKTLTGKDVAFSILALKEISSVTYLGTVLPVTYVRIVSDVPQWIVVDVGMDVAKPHFHPGIEPVGSLPVVPCNLFSTGLQDRNGDGVPEVYTAGNCGNITTGVTYLNVINGTVSGMDRRADFDPTFVPDEDGDGIPESACDDLGSHRTGHKGSGPFILECTSTGTGAVGGGGTLVLRPRVLDKSEFAKSREYWSSPHNYLQWRWADFNNNGVVDTSDKARTRLSPPIGCRNKPVPIDQSQWDTNGDGVPDDDCVQFDFNRNGVAADFSDRARMTLEGGKRWTNPCVWPWPGGLTCRGVVAPNYRTVVYPWVSWVWWLGHQCIGPDRVKGTPDDDKNACWFTRFTSRPP